MKNEAKASASTCNIALKEWAATCAALEAGRQILLLRKGGLADAGGVFELEHSQFWLWPTGFHQSATLLKPDDRHFIRPEPLRKDVLEFSLWAQVARVWTLHSEHLQVLEGDFHIWSDDYLAIRTGYKLEHPLLCVALRVWKAPLQSVPMRGEYGGCKSWIELHETLSIEGSTSVLSEETFAKYLQQLENVLKPEANGAN